MPSPVTDGNFIPRMDVAEKKDDVVVTVELPGVSKDDVKISLEQDLLSTTCKKCNAAALYVDETKDLVDELIDLAEKQNANVAVISTETDEGVMLKDSFGGIAAILRYKVS
jgi:peptide subunit release factor 1 (eRF1)